MHMSLTPSPGIAWYLRYNAGFTVLSLLVPLAALIVSFLLLTSNTHSLLKFLVGGPLTGGTVALMHFSASFKINFKAHFKPVYLVFSIFFAVLSTNAALYIFFRIRAHWEDSWWKRGGCALLLAAGISAMHYVGQGGTSYFVPNDPTRLSSVFSTNQRQSTATAAAVGAMCGAILISCFLVVLGDYLNVRAARDRARKIAVCSATFDRQGRLLVKPDGTVPMVVIESSVPPKEMLHYLDRRSPLFLWLFAVSWDWAIVTPFVRAVDARFRRMQPGANSLKERKRTLGNILLSHRHRDAHADDREKKVLTDMDLFDLKDGYISAAHELSDDLGVPMDQVGVLFDRCFPNGSLLRYEQRQREKLPQRLLRRDHKKCKPNKRFNPDETEQVDISAEDLDTDEGSISSKPVSSVFLSDDIGRDQQGLLLFLVREVGAGNDDLIEDEMVHHAEQGYRFTETRFLTKVLSDRLSVPKPEMITMLDTLKIYAKRGTRPVVQPGGVYLGLFGVRSAAGSHLDVLVYNFAHQMIPSYRIPDVKQVTGEMQAFLRILDQLSLDDAMRTCERESIRSDERRRYLPSDEMMSPQREEELCQFQMALYIAMDALVNAMSFYPRIGQLARLSSVLLEMPSSMDDSTPPALMVLAQAVLPSADRETGASPYRAMDQSSCASESNDDEPIAGIPTETDSTGTPFIFVPYDLFSKAQMMMMRGKQADLFDSEVVDELRRRYPNACLEVPLEDGSDNETPSWSRSGRRPLAALAAAAGLGSSMRQERYTVRSGGRSSRLTTSGSRKGPRRPRSRRQQNPETYELTSRLRLDPDAGAGSGQGPWQTPVSKMASRTTMSSSITPNPINISDASAESSAAAHSKHGSDLTETHAEKAYAVLPDAVDMEIGSTHDSTNPPARVHVLDPIPSPTLPEPELEERLPVPPSASTIPCTIATANVPHEIEPHEEYQVSVFGRARSDDWAERQLDELGRGPSGPLLLGVSTLNEHDG